MAALTKDEIEKRLKELEEDEEAPDEEIQRLKQTARRLLEKRSA